MAAIVTTNYSLRSESVSNAAWTKTRCSVTDNTVDFTAPNGTSTAGKWLEDATAAQTHFFQAAASPLTVRQGECPQFSFYLRGGLVGGTTRRVYVQWHDGTGQAYALFNPRTGLVDQQGTSDRNLNEMIAAPNSWFRCSTTCLQIPAGQESATSMLFFELDGGANAAAITNVYDGDGVSGVYIWGIQLVTAGYTSGPPEYVVTAGAPVIGNPRGLVR